jgi:predicted DNA-binding transcriptional regulator AlpA
MSKNFFDPEFGEMIAIGEVEALTGISKATIRNWRKPEHQHLAKFDYYSNGGRDVFYRRADIDAYLAEFGVQVGQSGFKRIEMPNSVKAPLTSPEFVGEQRDIVLALSKITTENVYWQLNDWMRSMGKNTVPVEWKNAWAKVNESLDVPVDYVQMDHRWENPVWFTQATHTARVWLTEMRDYDFPVSEVLKLAVGAVPPLKEKK